jgi:hypothetical protein
MSFDIDLQKYSGVDSEPAAVVQPVDSNSYQQEAGEYATHPELMDQPPKNEAAPEPEQVDANPQAENFRALRGEVDRLKAQQEAEKREYQLQLDMLRANMANQNRPKQPEPKQMFDGMKDDDVPNVSELRKEWEARESNYQARLEELQVQQAHPDYAEVIEKYALPLVQQKPHLAEGLRGATNKALFAYELGVMARQMQTPAVAAPTKSENAQKMVDNARKPGTLSQAGGQSVLSKADYFASMSDQEFMRMAKKNLDEI